MYNQHNNPHLNNTFTYTVAQSVILFTGRCFLQLLKTHDKKYAALAESALNIDAIIHRLKKYSASSIWDQSLEKVFKSYAALYCAYHTSDHFVINSQAAKPIQAHIAEHQMRFKQALARHTSTKKESMQCINTMTCLSELDEQTYKIKMDLAETWQNQNALRYIAHNQRQIESYTKMAHDRADDYIQWLSDVEYFGQLHANNLSVERMSQDLAFEANHQLASQHIAGLYEPGSDNELHFIVQQYKKFSTQPAYIKEQLLKPLIGKVTDNVIRSSERLVEDYLSEYKLLVETAAKEKLAQKTFVSQQQAKVSIPGPANALLMKKIAQDAQQHQQAMQMIEQRLIRDSRELDSNFRKNIDEFVIHATQATEDNYQRAQFAKLLPYAHEDMMQNFEVAKNRFSKVATSDADTLTTDFTMQLIDGQIAHLSVTQQLALEMNHAIYYVTFDLINRLMLNIAKIMRYDYLLSEKFLLSQPGIKTRLLDICENFEDSVKLMATSSAKDEMPAIKYRQALAPFCKQILLSLEQTTEYYLSTSGFDANAYTLFITQHLGGHYLIHQTAAIFGVSTYAVTDNLTHFTAPCFTAATQQQTAVVKSINQYATALDAVQANTTLKPSRFSIGKLLAEQKLKLKTLSTRASRTSSLSSSTASLDSGYDSISNCSQSTTSSFKNAYQMTREKIAKAKNKIAEIMMATTNGFVNQRLGQLHQQIGQSHSEEQLADMLSHAYNDPSFNQPISDNHPIPVKEKIRSLYAFLWFSSNT